MYGKRAKKKDEEKRKQVKGGYRKKRARLKETNELLIVAKTNTERGERESVCVCVYSTLLISQGAESTYKLVLVSGV